MMAAPLSIDKGSPDPPPDRGGIVAENWRFEACVEFQGEVKKHEVQEDDWRDEMLLAGGGTAAILDDPRSFRRANREA